MNDGVYDNGIVSCIAATALKAGSPCTLKDGKLSPWATADNTSGKAVQIFFPQFDAEAGEAVSAKLAGNAPGTILAPCVAGTYTAGAPVFAADGGLVAVSGTRVVGTALETVTRSESGTLHIVPQHVPAA